MTVQLYEGATRPTIQLWWEDSAANLIDFSSGYTFQAKLVDAANTVVLTKTTGITGAAGAGSLPTGTPNIIITWATNDLAGLVGDYTLQLKATDGNGPRFSVLPVHITATF